MIIVQLSDTHISARGKKTCRVAPMADNLVRCVEHINCFRPRPDLVLVSGDITHSGQAEESGHVAELLEKLEIPCYIIPGNHDNTDNLLSAFAGTAAVPATLQNDAGRELNNYVIDDYEVRLIALDNTADGKPGGEICTARPTWLDAQLSSSDAKPTIIFTHHPPVKLSVRETNFDGFSGTDLLGEVIERHANIERIACGHVHLPTFVRYRGYAEPPFLKVHAGNPIRKS